MKPDIVSVKMVKSWRWYTLIPQVASIRQNWIWKLRKNTTSPCASKSHATARQRHAVTGQEARSKMVPTLKDITPYRRIVENTLPITVQCLKCRALDTLYATVKNGKIVSWDYDPNYRVTQRTIYHVCGGVCKSFYPGSINQF
jgi:hypothetical protein